MQRFLFVQLGWWWYCHIKARRLHLYYYQFYINDQELAFDTNGNSPYNFVSTLLTCHQRCNVIREKLNCSQPSLSWQVWKPFITFSKRLEKYEHLTIAKVVAKCICYWWNSPNSVSKNSTEIRRYQTLKIYFEWLIRDSAVWQP